MDFPLNPVKDYGKLVEKLGEGTYGTVYLMKGTKESYALKISRLDEDDGIKSAELREIAILKQLNHPNIISLIDINIDKTKTYMILELAEGNLSHFQESNIEELKIITMQMVNALRYLFSFDIIHRDLKPNNVLYTTAGKHKRIILADFGLSRQGKCMNIGFSKEVYTLWYRPPEILLGGNYNAKADIWALGCMIGEMYKGKPLFAGHSEIDTLLKIFNLRGTPTDETWKEAKNLPDWSGKYPEYKDSLKSSLFGNNDLLTDFIEKCLTLNPEKRASIDELYYHKFLDGVREKFTSSVSRDNFFYRPKIIERSCLELLSRNQYYPSEKKDIEKSRPILYEWLVDVVAEYKFNERVLAKSLYLCDRYMSLVKEVKDMQLIGITCVMIASKYDAIYGLDVSNAEYITDKTYNKEQILKMEKEILKMLNFDLYISTVADFLQTFKQYYPDEIGKMSMILFKISTPTTLCFKYLPEEIATAFLLISCVLYDSTFKHKTLLSQKTLEIPEIFFSNVLSIKEAKNIAKDNKIEIENTYKTYLENKLKIL